MRICHEISFSMQKRNYFHRLQQKRYSRGTYKNPYFQAQKKSYTVPLFATGATSILICFFIVYFLSYPTFALTRVEITGLEPSSNQQMNNAIHDYLNQSHLIFFHNTNKFLFSEKKLHQFLSKQFAFDQLSIHVKKQTVSLSVKERTSDIIWKSNENVYLADLEGVITQKIDLSAPHKDLPVFTDKNGTPVQIGDHILDHAQINHILAFQQKIQSSGISVSEIQIDMQIGKWIGFNTSQGYKILFNPTDDPQVQYDRFQTIIRDTIKDTSKLQYIDLRFGDHIYYK